MLDGVAHCQQSHSHPSPDAGIVRSNDTRQYPSRRNQSLRRYRNDAKRDPKSSRRRSSFSQYRLDLGGASRLGHLYSVLDAGMADVADLSRASIDVTDSSTSVRSCGKWLQKHESTVHGATYGRAEGIYTGLHYPDFRVPGHRRVRIGISVGVGAGYRINSKWRLQALIEP